MNFFANKDHMTKDQKTYFTKVEQTLTERLTMLGESIKKAQENNMPSFFVNKLLDFEDALSDALFCLQTELDLEFKSLLLQLETKAV